MYNEMSSQIDGHDNLTVVRHHENVFTALWKISCKMWYSNVR